MKLAIKTKTSASTMNEILAEEEKKQQFEEEKQKEEKKQLLSNLKKGNLRKSGAVKKDNKFHLPVLHINSEQMWESKKSENRLHFTDEIAYNTCVGNCCGHEGLKAGCCYLDPDDIEHVLGPLDEDWIKGFVKWLRKQGFGASRHDVVIDFEEGKLIGDKFFGGHAVFHSKESYPILRIQAVGPRFACKFLNFETGKCTIYEHRPDMCRNYLCNYIKGNFLIQDKNHPSKWVKLR